MLILILLLVGCTTNANNYNQQLSGWVGQSPEALMETWGQPANVMYITPNESVMVYVSGGNAPISDKSNPYSDEVAYGPIATPNYAPEQPENLYYCKTSFTVQNNEIIDFSFNGDDCIATN